MGKKNIKLREQNTARHTRSFNFYIKIVWYFIIANSLSNPLPQAICLFKGCKYYTLNFILVFISFYWYYTVSYVNLEIYYGLIGDFLSFSR